MSVPKSKRSKSSVEFEMIYFRLARNVDYLVENNFFVSENYLEKNKIFIETRSKALSEFTDDLLLNIKIANSIYPTCELEIEQRRIKIGNAIGICFAILTQYTRILEHLKIKDDRYTQYIENVVRMINSLKTWRKSDNRFRKENFKKQNLNT